MILALIIALFIAGTIWAARPGDRGHNSAKRFGMVGLVALSPLLLAAGVLYQADGRMAVDRLSFEGKRLSFGAGEPITIGGSSADSGDWEDLRSEALPAKILRIESADDELATRLQIAPGKPVLRVGSPAPAIQIAGKRLNHFQLADGDRLVLGAVEPAIVLTFNDGRLSLNGESLPLPSSWKRLFRGGSTLVHLPDLLKGKVDDDARRSVRSALTRRGALGPWHLLIRESTTRIERGEQTLKMADAFGLPDELELTLQVAWGQENRRYWRTLRRDQLRIAGDRAEVRFGAPQQIWVDTRNMEADGAAELALVTASTVDRRRHQLELAERSSRFEGLSATLSRQAPDQDWHLEWLGDRRQVESGSLQALGEGDNQLLIRLQPTFQPLRVLLDLLVYGLLMAAFLGPIVARRPYLGAIIAPVGWLLALRLLFAERAAGSPPDFSTTVYSEARIALWLVPALLLIGWVAARWLRWSRPGVPGGVLHPSLGVVLASMGGAITTWGMGTAPFLAVLPCFLLLVVFAAMAWLGKSVKGQELWNRWRDHGWGLGHWKWVIALGVTALAIRVIASTVGMPETLRLPLVDFRVLWTVIQLPICAFVFALGAQRAQAAEATGDNGGDSVALSRLRQLLALAFFLGTAYLLIALWVRDTGLIIAHGLAPVAALVLLAVLAKPTAGSGRSGALHWAGVALCLLPFLGVLVVNAQPSWVVSLVGWGSGVTQDEDAGEAQVIVDQAAALSSTRAQQLFRLYMLSSPEDLRDVGLQPSEQVAIHYETLKSYAEGAGLMGAGLVSSPLPKHMGITYFSDLVPMVFMLADFGLLGVMAVAAIYGALLIWALLRLGQRASSRSDFLSVGDPWSLQGRWIAILAAFAFSLPSLYMILANLNLVLFTGKNCNLLSLNSISDVLESSILLALMMLGLGLEKEA